MTDEPQLAFSGFRFWVQGYQFPEATDDWDSKWLNARARFETHSAMVEAEGPFLTTTDIHTFQTELERMQQTLTGSATLAPLEPNLRIEIKCDHLGHLACELSLTPDHMTQKHEFSIELDQTYLASLIGGCKRILSELPDRK
jgi:hypothetical protein